MRGWRGGAAALLVAAVLLPAPLLLKRRAAAPADEWRARRDRALDRALAGLDDEPPWRRDDEDLDRALAPRRRLAEELAASGYRTRQAPSARRCSSSAEGRHKRRHRERWGDYEWFQVRAADIDGDGTRTWWRSRLDEVDELHWYEDGRVDGDVHRPQDRPSTPTRIWASAWPWWIWTATETWTLSWRRRETRRSALLVRERRRRRSSWTRKRPSTTATRTRRA